MHATQTALPGSEIVLIGLITSAVVIAQATWPLVQHFEVMAHEGMHAVAGSLNGRTGVPKDVWHVLWLCGTLTALVIGAHWILFPAVHPVAR